MTQEVKATRLGVAGTSAIYLCRDVSEGGATWARASRPHSARGMQGTRTRTIGSIEKAGITMPKEGNKRARGRQRASYTDSDESIEKRWRPWRPHTAQQNDSIPFNILSGVIAKADIIPIFDPEKNDIETERWINKIEQLGAVHNWSDEMKSYFMQARLAGMAKVWHASLQNYEMTWAEWREQLLEAFPNKIDYVELLKEMLNRKKIVNENMTQYFYSKYALLNRLDISGEKAVACIIDGLPIFMKAPARAGNYSTPSELYSRFLTMMTEKSKAFNIKNRDEIVLPNPYNVNNESRKSLMCFLCKEMGHTARRCSKNEVNIKTQCKYCGKAHPSEKCWFKPTSSNISKQPDTINMITEVNDIYFRYVILDNIQALAYFDSGAKVNIMNFEFFTKTNLVLMNCNIIIAGFGGKTVVANGIVNANVIVDSYSFNTKFVVTECSMGRMELILGQPVINNPNYVFIISGNTFTVKDKQLSETDNNYECFDRREHFKNCTSKEDTNFLDSIELDDTDQKSNKVNVYCKKDTEIPPGHIMLINVISEITPNETIYIESCTRMYDNRYYYIPACTIHSSEGVLEVRNQSSFPLLLTQRETLLRGLKCDESDVHQISALPAESVMTIDINKVKSGPQCSAEIVNRLNDILGEYSDCFSMDTTELGCTDKIEMNIELNSEKPVCYRPYRLSMPEKERVREKINDLLKNKVIQESSSEYASPIILVRKKTGDYRLCVDFRKLNSLTVKDKYPLPIIEDQVEKLAGKRFFTSLDLSQGFYQIPMAQNSIPRTGFVTPEGHYEFLRMPFGLANSPCVFQRLMDKILGPLRFEKVLPYIDDLLIPSTTEEEGLYVLCQVLQILREAKLTLNIDKCSFLQTEVEYLGYDIISERGIRPAKRKIEAVSKYQEPTNIHELRMFLGLTNYFRKFVYNYAFVAHELTKLLKKDSPWIWESGQQNAFDKLKQVLTERPILAVYDPKANTEVHTDASSKGIAGILLQSHENSLRPVAYYSRKTSKEEALYHSFELETLAVVETLKRFRVYLAGIHFIVVTDCAAVRQTFEKRDLLPRVARWWLSIQEYNMDIQHKPGVCHKHVDALSRTPVGIEQVMVLELLDWVYCLQSQDDSIRIIKQKLEDDVDDLDIRHNYTLKENKVYRNLGLGKLRIVVPKAARWNIMRKYHDDIGHPGLKKM
ncbi:jg23584 [Pararge aegeria aegeria]|uniref:Jg23584 protein n=1 Tax=Pararge aegeria aegeria TaxID=348720 RepID=A0A8S4RS06_9NEOP|nr:jg23584 [Pararge aegeria aegeria]